MRTTDVVDAVEGGEPQREIVLGVYEEEIGNVSSSRGAGEDRCQQRREGR